MILYRILQMIMIPIDSFMMLYISSFIIIISLIISILAPILIIITPIQQFNIKGSNRKLSYMCNKKSLEYRPNWTLLSKSIKNHQKLDLNIAELLMQLCTLIYNNDEIIVKEIIHLYELECDEVICGGKRTGTFICFSVDNGVMFVVMRGKELLDSDGWLIELTPSKIRSDTKLMPAGMIHQPSHNILEYTTTKNSTTAQLYRRRSVWEQERSKSQHNADEVLVSPTYYDSSGTPRLTEALMWTMEEILKDEFGYSSADGRWLHPPKIWLTGHGLGGTLATLLAAHFATLKTTSSSNSPKWLNSILECYSFGGLRPGDSELAESISVTLTRADYTLYRFIAANDIVPYLPPSSNIIHNLFKIIKKMQSARRSVDDGLMPQSMLDFAQPGEGIYLSYRGIIKNSRGLKDMGMNFTNWMIENVILIMSILYQGSPLNMIWSFITGQTIKDIMHAIIYRFILYDSLPQSYLDRIRECSTSDSITSYYAMPTPSSFNTTSSSMKNLHTASQQQIIYNNDSKSETSSIGSFSVSSRRIITVSTNRPMVEADTIPPSAEPVSAGYERNRRTSSTATMSPEKVIKWSFTQK